MSQTIAIDDLPQGPAAETVDEWSARRRLVCMVALSVASWIAILAPLAIWA
jgi:hypothetical protein